MMNSDLKVASSVVELMQRCVADHPDSDFLDFSGVQFSYRETWARCIDIAKQLDAAGVQAGSVVASMVGNSVDAFAVWLAANMHGRSGFQSILRSRDCFCNMSLRILELSFS